MRPILPILLSVIWMSLIFYFSSLPASSTGPDTVTFKVISKMIHFIIFGILSMLYLYSLKWRMPIQRTGMWVFILSLFLTIIYAITDEYHQSFSSGRYSSVKDVILDASGAVAFLGITYKLTGKRNNKYNQIIKTNRVTKSCISKTS